MRTYKILIMKKPSLKINPQLTDSYSRERWIADAYETNGSESAKLARVSIVSRLDHYCLKVHKMKTEDVFEWMKKEAKTSEILTQYAIDFLSQYVKFCQKDHKDIIINKGRNTKTNKLSKKNYLHKLHNNSIPGKVFSSRGFMSQVGGIRIHNDDMKRVPIPNTIKKGMYDDEEAEPLTAEQARNVISMVKNQRSIAIYNFMNDTAFRISETSMVVDSDFDFNARPPTVKTPNISVKGVLTRGVRYMRLSTSVQIQRLLTGDDKHFTFRHTDSQTMLAFRNAEYKKIKQAYDKLGMDKVNDDTGRRNFNLHSWRKRCGTEYARSNNESMSDGYLRHSKYLAQYHLKTKEERIEAFKRAEIDLAIDETEKLKVKNRDLEEEKSELEALKEKFKSQLTEEAFIKRMRDEVIAELNDPVMRKQRVKEFEKQLKKPLKKRMMKLD